MFVVRIFISSGGDLEKNDRLSTYIWHIKVNVNGVVRSVRGDTPETKRKVVAYELCNVNEVADRLKVMGVMDASQTFIDIPVKTLKKFRPKKVKKLKASVSSKI